MRTAQLLLSLMTLGLLLITLYAQREGYWLITQQVGRQQHAIVLLEKRLNALEEDDCSQVPLEFGTRSSL